MKTVLKKRVYNVNLLYKQHEKNSNNLEIAY
jgi:hypothetical protein